MQKTGPKNQISIPKRIVVIQSCWREGDSIVANVGITGADDRIEYNRVRVSGKDVEYLDVEGPHFLQALSREEWHSIFTAHFDEIMALVEALL